jgi:hypothetical protein
MFCPKCGDEMVNQDGELTCIRGAMGLSQQVHNMLMERFKHHSLSPRGERANTIRVYPYSDGFGLMQLRPWFCPGCGVVLDEKLSCPECGTSILDLLFPLTELHPHRWEDGSLS